MRPSPLMFAKAFLAILAATPKQKQAMIVKNLVRAALKYGGRCYLYRIVEEVARLYRQKRGYKKVMLYSARPLTKKHRMTLTALFNKSDEVAEKIDPELIAGVKIVIDDEFSLDNTLKKKLETLFNSY